jgi:hypothetical protein
VRSRQLGHGRVGRQQMNEQIADANASVADGLNRTLDGL